jgi:hypothetical protein
VLAPTGWKQNKPVQTTFHPQKDFKKERLSHPQTINQSINQSIAAKQARLAKDCDPK